MTKNKTIGILGGMGPEASANLYHKMIKYTQNKYKAVQDHDYPPAIIYSLPLKGFDETGIVNEKLVEKQLINGVKRLEKSKCDLIIIACNTVHHFYNQMQKSVKIPIFNIIDETKKRVKKAGYDKVGLFASESTTKLNLYEKSFEKSGITVISPSKTQQKALNRVIKHVMAGNHGKRDIIILKKIAKDYINKGAQAVVMGCTEIPLAINQSDTKIKLFDSLEIIIECAVDSSLK
ncbi:aspartate racemase [archaeon]|nr:aspartate racemase [archaeon]|tara:strand:- start:624 stop:1325 length:702 start_codon:yes stop_codon:yes gene_type:complete